MKRRVLVSQFIMRSDVDNREIVFWIPALSKKQKRRLNHANKS